MSRVAQKGADTSPRMGEVNIPCSRMSGTCRSRLSMNEGIVSAR